MGLLSFSLVMLVGCGADVAAACEGYVDEINTCYADYSASSGVDMSAAMLSTDDCADTYTGKNDAETAAYFDCLAGVYAETDCADPNAYAALDWSACGG